MIKNLFNERWKVAVAILVAIWVAACVVAWYALEHPNHAVPSGPSISVPSPSHEPGNRG